MSARNEKAFALPVVIFTAAYQLLSAAWAMARGNQEFIFYIVVMLVLIVLLWAVHRRVRLSQGALWALSVWGLAHMMGGLVVVPEAWPVNAPSRVLYSLWLIPGGLKYDHVVHAYGFGVTTWVCWQGLRGALRARGVEAGPAPGLLLLAGAAGMGFGALNEIVEFVATLLVPETNVGGYINTGWDLVSNLCGATLAATLIYFFDRPKPLTTA